MIMKEMSYRFFFLCNTKQKFWNDNFMCIPLECSLKFLRSADEFIKTSRFLLFEKSNKQTYFI